MSLTLHTTHGNVKIELFCELCPKACRNFLALAASGYYDNTIFHRNIKSTAQVIKLSSFKEAIPAEQASKGRASTAHLFRISLWIFSNMTKEV